MDLRQRLQRVSPASWARPLLFYALALLYLRWVIDPRVLFDAFGFILPYPTWDGSLPGFPGHPGDFARGLGVVASEMYQSPWWGARNIAGTAFALWLGTRILMRLAAGNGPGLAAYLPPVLLLAAFTAFEHPPARYDDYQGPQTSALALDPRPRARRPPRRGGGAVRAAHPAGRLPPALLLRPLARRRRGPGAGGAGRARGGCGPSLAGGRGLPGGRGRPALGPDPAPVRPDPRRRHDPPVAAELLDPPRGLRIRHGHVAVGARGGGGGRRLEPPAGGRRRWGDRSRGRVGRPRADGPAAGWRRCGEPIRWRGGQRGTEGP